MQEQEEITQLLNRLKQIKSMKKEIVNNANTWSCIRAKDWAGAGFKDEAEAKQWISDNPYFSM
jgi:hypothetical protein